MYESLLKTLLDNPFFEVTNFDFENTINVILDDTKLSLTDFSAVGEIIHEITDLSAYIMEYECWTEFTIDNCVEDFTITVYRKSGF